jgi:DNA-binding MarR family transcriptional regulator
MNENTALRDWEHSMPLPIRRVLDAAHDTELTGLSINLFAEVAMRATSVGNTYEVTVTLRELAEKLGSGIATLSRSFSLLERKGYVRRAARTKFGEPSRITILPSTPVAG